MIGYVALLFLAVAMVGLTAFGLLALVGGAFNLDVRALSGLSILAFVGGMFAASVCSLLWAAECLLDHL